jgi:hypothetical protein
LSIFMDLLINENEVVSTIKNIPFSTISQILGWRENM